MDRSQIDGGDVGDQDASAQDGGADGAVETDGGHDSGNDSGSDNGCGAIGADAAAVCDDEKAETSDFCAATVGCAHLSVTSGTNTPIQGNALGGDEYLDMCPPGRVLIGFNAEIGDSFDTIQVVCGAVGVDATPAVTIESSEMPFPLRGTNDNAAGSTLCPANQFAVGFGGRAGVLVDQVVLRCASATFSSGAGGLSATLSVPVNQAALGGTGGVAFADTDCPAGSVAIGGHIRVGGSVDGLGLLCGIAKVE